MDLIAFLAIALVALTVVCAAILLGFWRASKNLAVAKTEIENLKQRLKDQEVAAEAKLALLDEAKEKLKLEFKVVAGELFTGHSNTFKEQNKEQLEGLLKPLDETLGEYKKQLREMEKLRNRDEGQLVQQLRQVAETQGQLKDTTLNLVNALRSAPKTRGRWGEEQIRNVLEMAGMTEHIDYIREVHVSADEGSLRPDVVLNMPGGQKLVIDVKTPLAAYLEAVEVTDEEIREKKLQDHAKQLRSHAMKLGAKEYWKQFKDTPEFVVMFVPGDNLYSAAFERDPDLFQDAYDRQVIVTTPTTFLALAKAVSFGWRQEKATQEAKQIHNLGVELYKRLSYLGTGLAKLTKSLDQTVKNHNALIGSLESRVLPQARKFNDYGVGVGNDQLDELEQIETDVRQPVGRDLVAPDHSIDDRKNVDDKNAEVEIHELPVRRDGDG